MAYRDRNSVNRSQNSNMVNRQQYNNPRRYQGDSSRPAGGYRRNNAVGNHKHSKINIGFLCMVFILIYLISIIVAQANKTKIFSYQVKAGSLAISNIYTGIAIRQEDVFPSSNSGYIDYFAREGEHVGVGDLIYTIDEGGVMDDLLNGENGGDNTLTDEDLSELKSSIVNFSSNYSNDNFQDTYDFLYSIDGNILKLTNQQLLKNVADVNSNSYSDLIQFGKATEAGYVVYNIDGYENLTVDTITPECFDQDTYEKQQLLNNSLVDAGTSVYKIIPNEDWSIVIPLEEDRALELMEESYVQIRFLENQKTLWAKLEIVQNGEEYYGVLTMNSSCVSFCTDRYIDIELISSAQTGLKIPISSIVYKQFYLIPEAYVLEDGEDNNCVITKKIFLEDGSVSSETMTIEVYAKQDGYYYVDDTQLKPGDYLLYTEQLEGTGNNITAADLNDELGGTTSTSSNSSISSNGAAANDSSTFDNSGTSAVTDSSGETATTVASEYAVSQKGQLVGVYNMNKGYADFRQIVILYQNEEYAIIRSNTNYGLNEYDFIVLDASAVSEDDFIYE